MKHTIALAFLMVTMPLICFDHTAIITQDKKPSPLLLELLEKVGVEKSHINLPQPKGLLRAPDKERWQIASFFKAQEESIRQHCQKLNMFNEIAPRKKNYTYALLTGATIHRVRARLAYLVQLWQEGIRFEKLIFLVGQRPLSNEVESIDDFENAQNGHLLFKEGWKLEHVPQTETEMAQMVFEQSELPSAWSSLQVEFIDTPLQNDKRPNRQNTVEAWLKTDPQPGSILSITNQPFVGYDDAVLRRLVPTHFSLEVVGCKARNNILPEVLLDTIARWTYNAQLLNPDQLNGADI